MVAGELEREEMMMIHSKIIYFLRWSVVSSVSVQKGYPLFAIDF